MKDLFPSYYSPSDEDFSELWQRCFFIFDTNVLLDFYEHRNETREIFFKVLQQIPCICGTLDSVHQQKK
ncbi:PIN-like domain-containing protein [Microcoleus sp. S36b_A4]|uniref:PIN-like domain-containing protein n=1 Tax=Microcoleus sp. S36b_A4 TaxID=3055420 RepID=UPI002FD38D05